ncbi:MAG: hypothetical protein J7K57_00765 [Palaeococcus sp.]|uniref:KEOPS complex subunit Pcc1 n=1 Tax=Palaeococcus sp. (in: euryarchaeotes) TaxID=2820298 RepID=UPI0025D6D396|nr:KEOPS complex subunit Pcc1 [Palaeococcus sp. (in: euryarchaeotes)]MCD6558406.1 hypothetical protein [Palaeococcus sp. (in: euryarchaeotes)]
MSEPIEGFIEIEFPSEEIARVVYESVLIEDKSVPYRRTRTRLLLEGKRIKLEFTAKDNSALRGTLNSYLRWIKVALDTLDL